ncbi:MAG: hypothetical protein ACYTBP_06175 [Planctomycetota bacterium]|jgi:Tfp pilus assembly protein PilV
MIYHSERQFFGMDADVCENGGITADLMRQTVRLRGIILIEVMTALIILTIISSSILVVVNRCMKATADSTMKMRAFDIARENMEQLLVLNKVSGTVDYGISDEYPEIQWQTTVETFYEPGGTRMWVRAICLAEYIDTDEEVQTVELTHWLTNLSKGDMLNILNEQEKELAEYLIESMDDAAKYAGVDTKTITAWVGAGMPKTGNGKFIKAWLDLYKDTNGNPTPQQKQDIAGSLPDFNLSPVSGSSGKANVPADTSRPGDGGQSPTSDLTPQQMWDLIQQFLSNTQSGGGSG